jgi:hypothetical protein
MCPFLFLFCSVFAWWSLVEPRVGGHDKLDVDELVILPLGGWLPET